jgi:hypothetical protein
MRETTYHTVGANLLAVDPKGGDEPSELHVVLVSGLMLPIAGPDGQPLQVPFEAHKFPLSKEFALNFFQQGLEHSEKLKDAPKVDIATNMEGVADLAELAKRFRTNG